MGHSFHFFAFSLISTNQRIVHDHLMPNNQAEGKLTRSIDGHKSRAVRDWERPNGPSRPVVPKWKKGAGVPATALPGKWFRRPIEVASVRSLREADQITFASLVMAEIEDPDFRTIEANC
ncbi:hypothetical protein H8B02_34810 [Bradyrhizobium sp. Pear77]|uniref:hypothetical protein n=1 Tax=Bradyrhizobium altum TaxID=1571202 RepID=UPI001E54F37E|nr:hypothetical protein [Bradyrhizobium altum]MCC8958409.1 hypothetical protein [Bradyrhizobium altum]